MMTRADHLDWTKQRALAELDGGSDTSTVLASVSSDLMKHPELASHGAIELGMLLAMSGHLDTPDKMREWINGFN
jgi:hypothetical protein